MTQLVAVVLVLVFDSMSCVHIIRVFICFPLNVLNALAYTACSDSACFRDQSQRVFRVVEDGDKKGFQSGLGKEAKAEQKMQSWMLPPRSPALMPLDFCLWSEIEERTLKNTGGDQETRSQYAACLRPTALQVAQGHCQELLGEDEGQHISSRAGQGQEHHV